MFGTARLFLHFIDCLNPFGQSWSFVGFSDGGIILISCMSAIWVECPLCLDSRSLLQGCFVQPTGIWCVIGNKVKVEELVFPLALVIVVKVKAGIAAL